MLSSMALREQQSKDLLSSQSEKLVWHGTAWKIGDYSDVWKARWFKMSSHALYYFESKETERPIGKIDLNPVRYRYATFPTRKHGVELFTPDRIYFLSFDEEQSQSKFCQILAAQAGRLHSEGVPFVTDWLLHSGWTCKRGLINASWKQRFLRLVPEGLYYYTNDLDGTPKGFASLKNAIVKHGDHAHDSLPASILKVMSIGSDSKDHCLTVTVNSGREFVFAFMDAEEAQLWYDHIVSCIEKCFESPHESYDAVDGEESGVAMAPMSS